MNSFLVLLIAWNLILLLIQYVFVTASLFSDFYKTKAEFKRICIPYNIYIIRIGEIINGYKKKYNELK